jgi:hypothetical protein
VRGPGCGQAVRWAPRHRARPEPAGPRNRLCTRARRWPAPRSRPRTARSVGPATARPG